MKKLYVSAILMSAFLNACTVAPTSSSSGLGGTIIEGLYCFSSGDVCTPLADQDYLIDDKGGYMDGIGPISTVILSHLGDSVDSVDQLKFTPIGAATIAQVERKCSDINEHLLFTPDLNSASCFSDAQQLGYSLFAANEDGTPLLLYEVLLTNINNPPLRYSLSAKGVNEMRYRESQRGGAPGLGEH